MVVRAVLPISSQMGPAVFNSRRAGVLVCLRSTTRMLALSRALWGQFVPRAVYAVIICEIGDSANHAYG